MEKITLNQKAWIALIPEAQANDVLLFEAIKKLCKSGGPKIGEYSLIPLKKLIEMVPIAGIKTKSTVSGYVKKLEKWGIIATITEKQELYAKLLNKATLLN